MGFWNWIIGRSGSPDSKIPASSVAAPHSPLPDTAAVATLEPPPRIAIESSRPLWWSPPGAHLLDLAEVPRPDLAVEALALEESLLDKFDGHDLNLPPLPHVPERVLRRLRSVRCDFAEVAEDIGEDQVVAMAVLRMANSPLYRALQKITTIQAAVTRLGATAIRTLMLQQSLRAATFGTRGAHDPRARAIWARSQASATIMRLLAGFTQTDEEEAYLIGLLHDIGSIIVLRAVQEQQSFTRQPIRDADFEYLCAETHQEFGELIADAWQLPLSLKEIISCHHTPTTADDPLRTRRQLLRVTDMILSLLGYAPPAPYNLLESHPVVSLGLNHREDFVAMLEKLPEQLNEAAE